MAHTRFSLRMAEMDDAVPLVPLWKEFCRERAAVDPSMILKQRFDYEAFSRYVLGQPLSFCLLLDAVPTSSPDPTDPILAGFLSFFYFDESPPGQSPDAARRGTYDNPFEPRRCCNIFGIYVKPPFRQQGGASLMLNQWVAHTEEMKVSDIDVLISSDQVGLQKYFRTSGFAEAAVQFTRHRNVPRGVPLPNLHAS